MNTKAAMFGMKIFLYIAYAFFIMTLFLGTVSTMSSISGRMNHVPDDLENQLLRDRVFTAPECFAYQDVTGRAYEIIDIHKFTNETLQDCLHVENYPFDFRFSLEYYEEDFHYNTATSIPEWMLGTKEKEVATSGWFGSSFDESRSYPVLVRNHDNQTYLGEIEIAYQKSSRTFTDFGGGEVGGGGASRDVEYDTDE